jgi:hypothetical protein
MTNNTHIIIRITMGFCVTCLILAPDKGMSVSDKHIAGKYTAYLSQILKIGNSSGWYEKKDEEITKDASSSVTADQVQKEKSDETPDHQAQLKTSAQSISTAEEPIKTISQETTSAEISAVTETESSEDVQAVSQPVNTVPPQPAAAQTPAAQPPVLEGTAGHLTISSLGIDVPLYTAYDDAQTIVDADQSAAYMDWYSVPLIADHAGQNNFHNLAVAAGQTAVITRGGSQTAYICSGVYQGINTVDDLIVNGESYLTSVHGNLIIYTCINAQDTSQVYVTTWNFM